MRMINADELMMKMYHEAFETDTDMQKWDSGCWIRYKLFERIMSEIPAVDAVEVVRCKDCKHYVSDWNTDGYVCRHPKLEVDLECSDHWVATKETDHCSYGEKKE